MDPSIDKLILLIELISVFQSFNQGCGVDQQDQLVRLKNYELQSNCENIFFNSSQLTLFGMKITIKKKKKKKQE